MHRIWYNEACIFRGGDRIKHRDQVRFVLRCALLAIGTQLLVFYGTHLIPTPPPHILTSRLDEAIPVAPVWITVYFLVFVDWLACAIAILFENRSHARWFTAAYVIGMLMAGVIFVVYPCTMERPEILGSDPFSLMMRLLYRIDTPTNLFPSLHVMITYFCWRGSMGCEKLPKWFSTLQFGILICVCLSILFVKQHVLADIPAAIAVGEPALQLAKLLPEKSEE